MPEQQRYKSITGLVDRAVSPMSSSNALFDGLQRCHVCGRILNGKYVTMDSRVACVTCATAARDMSRLLSGANLSGANQPGTNQPGTNQSGATRSSTSQPGEDHAPFARALAYGAGAAVLGLAFYASFTIVTHIYLGYVALAVGWLVGKAMMQGSGGEGGPRYQTAAVALTYAAISLASIPIQLAEAAHQGTAIDWSVLSGNLFLGGIAAPFLDLQRDGAFGIIGLVIVFVGLRIAFRLTRDKQARPQATAVVSRAVI